MLRVGIVRWPGVSAMMNFRRARSRNSAVGHVNRDALLAFGAQPVGEHNEKINLARFSAIDAAFFTGRELIFVDI